MTQNRQQTAFTQEAARIVCEELVTDYGLAKRKAAERLGTGGRGAMPDNAAVQAAVIEYQRLFGGAAYHEQLLRLRQTALLLMKLLSEFSPRLVGAAVTGATTAAHRVQLHLFADKPEMLDLHLHERNLRFEQDERRYRYPDGREVTIPLSCLDVEGIGADLAVFPEGEMNRPPVNPTDGLQFRRLTPADVEKLVSASPAA